MKETVERKRGREIKETFSQKKKEETLFLFESFFLLKKKKKKIHFYPLLSANHFPKVTNLFCRLP